jgi:hypothetical protein
VISTAHTRPFPHPHQFPPISSSLCCSVDERKRWISEIQAAHLAVAPAAAASISQSLSKQNAVFAALDSGSKARLHAMFIDFVAKSKTAPRQVAAPSATVPLMDACCFDPSNGCFFVTQNPLIFSGYLYPS